MKKLIFIAFTILSSCAHDDINVNECINPEKWGDINACPDYLHSVCGCNNVTYSNDCYAKAAGVVEWTEGKCP